MDVLSLIGVILAFVAILGGNYLEGGHAGALLNGPAALIVIGGIYGMNFAHLPLTDSPLGFWTTLGLMAVVSAVLVFWLKRQRWF